MWEPTHAFFRKGAARVISGDEEIAVTWTFERVKRSDIGFSFVMCHMEAAGQRVEGQGYALRSMTALCQAFAEAWERLWVWRAAGGLIPGIDRVTSSNGFGAGQTDERAAYSARGELIERAILMEAWRTQRGWRPSSLTTLSAQILARVTATHGWTVRLFELDGEDLGTVIAGLAQHESGASVFDTVYVGGARRRGDAEAKLLRSVTRSALFGTQEVPDNWTLPEIGTPDDHARFYSDPASAAAFEFLKDPCSHIGTIKLNEPNAISTHIIFSAGVLPAVAVAAHPSWTPLGWGKSSIQGGNKWPHPLA